MSENEERQKFIDEALTWLGTRYDDHQERKGAGCDCAGLLKGSLVNAGLLDDFRTPHYSPQQWLHRNFEDRTYLSLVLEIADEINEIEVRPGDLVLYRFVESWTHGAIIVRWPEFVLHCVKATGVCGAHGKRDGLLAGPRRAPRFFRLKRWSPDAR